MLRETARTCRASARGRSRHTTCRAPFLAVEAGPGSEPWPAVPCGSTPLGVLADLAEIDPDAWLVADSFGVVAGRNRGGLAWPDLRLGAVVHVDPHASRDAVPEMGHLARVRLGDGLEVCRPLPTGLEHASRDRLAGEVDDVRLALALERPSFVRRLEVLDLHGRHCRSSRLDLRRASEPRIRAIRMQRAEPRDTHQASNRGPRRGAVR